MYEVEIKILEIDRVKTESMLLAAGARKIFDDQICAIYYDFGDSSIREGGGTLRLRREGGRAVLTFKRHVEDKNAKVREEQEVVVSDFLTTRSILEAIGLSVRIEMSKHRTTYELGGTHFEFDKYKDTYAYIPEFLEIESADIETAYRQAETLGFSREECRPWDAVQVAAYYSARTGEK